LPETRATSIGLGSAKLLKVLKFIYLQRPTSKVSYLISKEAYF
jgi:hypothetical protein